MSSHKIPNIIKYCVITSTVALVLMAMNTILISQKTSKELNSIKVEFKKVSTNIISLKKEIKNISIDLVPTKRQSQRWNKCFKNTALWVDKKERDLARWDKATKESFIVALCNGAVFEPIPKMK